MFDTTKLDEKEAIPVKEKRGQRPWFFYLKDRIHELNKLCKESGEIFNMPIAVKEINLSWKKMTEEEQKNYGSKEALPVKEKRRQSTWWLYLKDRIRELKESGKIFNMALAVKEINLSWKKMTEEEQKNYGSTEVVVD